MEPQINFRHRNTIVNTLNSVIPSDMNIEEKFQFFRRQRMLSDILEDPAEVNDEEEQSDSSLKKAKPNPIKFMQFNQMPVIKEKTPIRQYLRKRSIDISNKYVAFFHLFLTQLKQFPDVYKRLLSLTYQNKILGRQQTKSLEYYHRFISSRAQSQNSRKSNTPALPTINFQYESSVSSSDGKEDLNTSSNKQDLTPVDRAISRFLSRKQSSLNKSRSSSTSRQSKRGKLAPKPVILEKEDPKLVQHYKNIIGNTQNKPLKYLKLSANQMHSYLTKRYPNYMADVMVKHIDFKQKLSYEQFCTQMDRIIDGQHERILKFCFELFDFNRDQLIDFTDAFQAIKQRKDYYFDLDLTKISQAINAKKQQKQFFMKFKDKGKKEDKKQKNKRKRKLNQRKDAISFEEFQSIDFSINGPQIFQDFIKYCCRFNVNQKVPKPPEEQIERKNSEDVVTDMSISANVLNELKKDPKFDYYLELDAAMSNYSLIECEKLLARFDTLRDKKMKDLKVITPLSMKKNFQELFGAQNDYLAQRIYKLLSGPKNVDVTKAQFLVQVKPIVQGNRFDRSKFVFDIYDVNEDQILTVDELLQMLRQLPKHSPLHKECVGLIKEFQNSILGVRKRKLEEINFDVFLAMVPQSVLIKDLMETFEVKPISNRVCVSLAI